MLPHGRQGRGCGQVPSRDKGRGEERGPLVGLKYIAAGPLHRVPPPPGPPPLLQDAQDNEDEYEDYYDYSALEEQEAMSKQVMVHSSEVSLTLAGELVLPQGAGGAAKASIFGHRLAASPCCAPLSVF